jgi:hypothetical protein
VVLWLKNRQYIFFNCCVCWFLNISFYHNSLLKTIECQPFWCEGACATEAAIITFNFKIKSLAVYVQLHFSVSLSSLFLVFWYKICLHLKLFWHLKITDITSNLITSVPKRKVLGWYSLVILTLIIFFLWTLDCSHDVKMDALIFTKILYIFHEVHDFMQNQEQKITFLNATTSTWR